MEVSEFTRISLMIAVGAFCAVSHPAFAASGEDYTGKIAFFNKGAVTDLDAPMEETAQPEMEFYATSGFKIPKLKVAQPKSSQSSDKDQIGREEVEVPAGVDADQFKLRQEFGDPSDEVLVKGIDNTPKPYRAMLKAIEIGRDDLALEYANQWMEYMGRLDRVTKKASAMASVVKLDPSSDEITLSNEAVASIDPKALSEFIGKRQSEAIKQAGIEVEVNDQARQAIDSIFGETNQPTAQERAEGEKVQIDPYAKLVDRSMDEGMRRTLIRSELRSQVPVDPSGHAKVLFFFKPSEQISLDLGKELSTVLASPTLKVNLSVVPLSVESFTQEASAKFAEASGIQAMLRDGIGLSKSLGINAFPALVFVSSASDRAFAKSGMSDAVFIEEVAKMVGGK